MYILNGICFYKECRGLWRDTEEYEVKREREEIGEYCRIRSNVNVINNCGHYF